MQAQLFPLLGRLEALRTGALAVAWGLAHTFQLKRQWENLWPEHPPQRPVLAVVEGQKQLYDACHHGLDWTIYQQLPEYRD